MYHFVIAAMVQNCSSDNLVWLYWKVVRENHLVIIQPLTASTFINFEWGHARNNRGRFTEHPQIFTCSLGYTFEGWVNVISRTIKMPLRPCILIDSFWFNRLIVIIFLYYNFNCNLLNQLIKALPEVTFNVIGSLVIAIIISGNGNYSNC